MDVYIHIQIYVDRYVYIYIDIYIYWYIYITVYIYIGMYVCTNIYIYICPCIYNISMYMMCIYIWIQIYKLKYMFKSLPWS